jgi:hypothetical protein
MVRSFTSTLMGTTGAPTSMTKHRTMKTGTHERQR